MRTKIIRILVLCASVILMLPLILNYTENVIWASEEDSYDEENSEEYTDDQNNNQESSQEQEQEALKWPDAPTIKAQKAVLMNANSNVILYNKNKDDNEAPGNLTKYMTALVFAENSTLDDTITISYEALEKAEESLSALDIQEGEELTAKECLYIMLIESSDEVANQVALSVSGSIEGFVTLMNQKAQELGCTHTNFLNPTGKEIDGQVSSANDIALILAAAYQNETLKDIMTQPLYTVSATNKSEERTICNHMVFFSGEEQEYLGMLAGREGVIGDNDYYLVALAQRDDIPLISVVLKDEASENRNDARSLLDYGFHNFRIQDLSQGMEVLEKGQGMLPNDITIEDLKTIMVQESSGNVHIWYYYGDYNVGELLTTPASYNAFIDPEAAAAKADQLEKEQKQAEETLAKSKDTKESDVQKQKLAKIRKYIIYVLVALIIISILLMIILLISRALDRARKRKSRRRR